VNTPPQSQKGVIARNIKYSAVSRGVSFAVSFALLPFIVSHVGVEIYGAYLLVMTFIGYLGYLDFGVLSAVVKYVAEFMGKGDRDQASKVIRASFTFYVIVGILAALILYATSFWFSLFFKIGVSHYILVRQLFWVTAVASIFIWPGKTFAGVLRGLQRYDLVAKIDIAVRVTTALAAYLIFTLGLGMAHFLIVSYFLIMTGNIISYFLVRLYFKGYRIVSPYFKKEILMTVSGFSFFVFLASLTDIAIFQVDNFVVGALVSVSAVTLYNIAFTLQGGLRAVNSLFGGPLIPAVAEMEGRNDFHGQEMTLYKATKYMTFIFVPMIIVAIVFARPLITHWMGAGFKESVRPAQILMLFWIFNGTSQVASGILLSKGYAKVLFKIGALTAILNLGISIILAKYIGIVGVALGTAIPMVLVASPLVLAQALRILDVSLREYYNHAIKANLRTYLIAMILSVVVAKLLYPTHLVAVFLEMGIIYGVVLLSGFVVSFSSKERREMIALIKGKG
jgi:O-antigen/teichoic acid export membrane protein